MVIDENWGIPVERVRAFFRQRPDTAEQDGGFCCGACRIMLTPGSGEIAGKWTIPRTQIRIEGPEREVQAIYHQFFLRFLSAGG